MLKICLFVSSIFFVFCLTSKQNDIITSDSMSEAHSQSSLSGDSKSLSIANSEANNIKILQTTLDDYVALSHYQDNYIPLHHGSTFIEQVPLIEGNTQTSQVPFSFEDKALNPLDVVISPTLLGSCVPIQWKRLNLLSKSVSVGAQGDIYSVGLDGKLYYYDFLEEEFIVVNGDFDIGNIMKVVVASNGTPYVITASGVVYFMNVKNNWIKLPGCASDIAIGRGGEVFKIGCDVRLSGFGVYKLVDEGKEERISIINTRCLRKRGFCPECTLSYDFEEIDDNRNIYWFRMSGSGIKIAVDNNEEPYIVNAHGSILKYHKSKWHPIITEGNAREIKISNEGEIFYIDSFNNIFRILGDSSSVYQLCGVAKSISIGPFSQPFVVGIDNYIYTSSKFSFNSK